jgi:tetratricopeptide (TPR) repeat protein
MMKSKHWWNTSNLRQRLWDKLAVFSNRRKPPAGGGAEADRQLQAIEAYNRGVACYGNGEFEEAIGHFSDAIRLVPHLAKAYHSRSGAHLMKGDRS